MGHKQPAALPDGTCGRGVTEGREGGAADVCEEEGEALEGGAVGEGLVQQEARLLHLLEARRCTPRQGQPHSGAAAGPKQLGAAGGVRAEVCAERGWQRTGRVALDNHAEHPPPAVSEPPSALPSLSPSVAAPPSAKESRRSRSGWGPCVGLSLRRSVYPARASAVCEAGERQRCLSVSAQSCRGPEGRRGFASKIAARTSKGLNLKMGGAKTN